MKKKIDDQPLRLLLFKSVVAKLIGDEAAERVARKVSRGVISLILVGAALVQVVSAAVWAGENIPKFNKWRPLDDVRVMIHGGPSLFYPANSKVTLNVDISDKHNPAVKIEAKEDQVGLFNASGESAGFEKKVRFPEPIEFYRDTLPASQYSVIAKFVGNERARASDSDKYTFTVFEEDRFDPVNSVSRWYQVSANGAKADVHEPFYIRPDPASHKGDYLLFLKSSGIQLETTPMLWFRPQIVLPCELHLKVGPIGQASAFVVSFDDQFRVVVGEDPNNALLLPEGPNAYLTVYQRSSRGGSFLPVKKTELPRRILSEEQSYRVRLLSPIGGSTMYVIDFDVPGVLPSTIRTAFDSSVEMPARGNIGLGLISRSTGTYIREFQAFGVRPN